MDRLLCRLILSKSSIFLFLSSSSSFIHFCKKNNTPIFQWFKSHFKSNSMQQGTLSYARTMKAFSNYKPTHIMVIMYATIMMCAWRSQGRQWGNGYVVDVAICVAAGHVQVVFFLTCLKHCHRNEGKLLALEGSKSYCTCQVSY